MAEPNKMFAGASKLGKRVPKAAWYVAGGVVIAGGIFYLRNQDDAAYTEAPMDESGAVGYTDASTTGAPGIIVPPVIGGEAVPAEINTDIPVATLDLLGGIVDSLVGAIPTADDLQLLAGAGSPVAGSDAGGVVTVAPPPPPPPAPAPPPPKPSPCSRLEGGFHCGDTIVDGNLRKRIPGAVGWKRDSSGGSGSAHWIKYRVRHCTKLEIWTVYPNRAGDPWSRTHSQAASNLC